MCILHVLAHVYTTRASTCVLYTCLHVCLLHVLDYYSKTCPPAPHSPPPSSHLCDPRECVCHRIVVNVSRSKLKWIQVYERSSPQHTPSEPTYRPPSNSHNRENQYLCDLEPVKTIESHPGDKSTRIWSTARVQLLTESTFNYAINHPSQWSLVISGLSV